MAAHASIDDKYRAIFRHQGMEYYVAGRAAASSGLSWIYGNILHHAVEAFAKADLLGDVTIQFLRWKCGHDLVKIWSELTSRDPSFAVYDATIEALNKFERVRYPDGLINGPKKSSAKIAFNDAETIAATWGLDHPAIVGSELYEVVMADVDALVVALLDRKSIHPASLSATMTAQARDSIVFRNARASRWTY